MAAKRWYGNSQHTTCMFDERLIDNLTEGGVPPFDVCLHGPVALFATDTDRLVRRGVSVGGRVVVLLEPRVVAAGAHRVPVHAAIGPVAPFVCLAVLVAVDVEPLGGLRVPGQFGGLPSAVVERDEVLPEGVASEDGDRLEVVRLAVRAHRGDDVLAAPDADAGGLRAELKTEDGHPALYMYDADAKQRLALWTDDRATGLYLKDAEETTRVGAALFAQGGGFALHGPESRGAAVMTFMDGKREIRFYNDDGEVSERFPEAGE